MELKIHPSLIEQVVDIAESYGLLELEVQYKDYRVHVKRSCNEVVEVRGEAAPALSPVIEKRLEMEREQPDEHTVVVRSPLSGVFYRSPSPGSPSFVETGDSVTPGKTLCIIEAMKLMNEITSEHKGEIVRVLVENGNAVEGDQALFWIRLSIQA